MSMRLLLCCLCLILLPAQADVETRAKAAQLVADFVKRAGGQAAARARAAPIAKARTPICGYCHGKEGNSAHPDIPSLAGQNPAYVVEQLLNFQAEKRIYQAMHDLAQAMGPEDMVAVALHFSALQRVGVPVDPALAARGKPLYDALCQHCHGADGNGTQGYARLSAQRPEYVEKTLKRFRDGSRERRSPEMGTVTRGLSDADLQALSAYVAGL